MNCECTMFCIDRVWSTLKVVKQFDASCRNISNIPANTTACSPTKSLEALVFVYILVCFVDH